MFVYAPLCVYVLVSCMTGVGAGFCLFLARCSSIGPPLCAGAVWTASVRRSCVGPLMCAGAVWTSSEFGASWPASSSGPLMCAGAVVTASPFCPLSLTSSFGCVLTSAAGGSSWLGRLKSGLARFLELPCFHARFCSLAGRCRLPCCVGRNRRGCRGFPFRDRGRMANWRSFPLCRLSG